MLRARSVVARLAATAAAVFVGSLVAALTAGHVSSPATWVLAIAVNGSLIVLGICGFVLLSRAAARENDLIRR